MDTEFQKDIAELGKATERFNELFVAFQEKHWKAARASAFVQRSSDAPEDNRLIVTVDKFFAQFGREKP